MFYKIFDELPVQKVVDIFSLEDKEILEILLGAVIILLRNLIQILDHE